MTLYEATGIAAWYRSADRELHSAFDTARDRISATQMDRRLAAPSSTRRLLAVNMPSRAIFARYLCNEIAEQLCVNQYWEHDRPIFMVTIIPKAGIVGTETRDFEPRSIVRQLTVALRGIDYLAIVEPGYYSSLPEQDRTIGTQVISWHVHALVWNITISAVAAIIDKLNQHDAYGAVVPEMSAVHARQVNNGELPIVVGYLLKPPSRAKRIQRYPWIKNGEIVHYADGSIKFFIKQLTSVLQKSERLRLFHAMKHLSFDQLVIGGGDGKYIRAKALHNFDLGVAH